jgi:hypothetical protein
MTSKDLKAWLQERVPEIPPPFLEVLLEYHEAASRRPGWELAGAPGPDLLARLGEGAMERALGHPSRDRAGAFALLAGDAFLTYACEFLEEAGNDLPATLDQMIERLGQRFS